MRQLITFECGVSLADAIEAAKVLADEYGHSFIIDTYDDHDRLVWGVIFGSTAIPTEYDQAAWQS